MAKQSLAKAYVQIVPSAEGIQGSIEDILNKYSGKAGKNAGGLISSAIKKVFVTAGIGTALTTSIMEGAKLEQSIGGIKTLFKESADEMRKYASMAYANAGISANSYMEQATSFSASLLKSLGDDTAKAAEAANQAIIDMADNSNKMGTPLEMIQNAYQGFAKQNYTMLDNLKLGYGGTKTEMERLLKDAQKITGIKYDISNLNDVYSAIHVIQDKLKITGASATEAQTTLSGSFASMKASAQNFLGNLTLGEDIKPSLSALVSTTSTFLFKNLIPAVGNIVLSLPEAIGSAVVEIAPIIFDEGKKLMDSIIEGIQERFPNILTNGTEMVNKFINGIFDNMPALLSTVGQMMMNIATWIYSQMPNILDCGYSLLANFASAIIKNLPKILEVGISMVGELAAGIVKAIPNLLLKAASIYNDIKNKFNELDWKSIGKNIIDGIIKGISNAVSSLVNAAKDAAKSALNGMKNLLGIHSPSDVFADEVGEMIPAGTAEGILANLSPIKDAMKSLSKETLGMINDDYTVSKKIIVATLEEDFNLDKLLKYDLIEIVDGYLRIKKDKILLGNVVFEEFVG